MTHSKTLKIIGLILFSINMIIIAYYAMPKQFTLTTRVNKDVARFNQQFSNNRTRIKSIHKDYLRQHTISHRDYTYVDNFLKISTPFNPNKPWHWQLIKNKLKPIPISLLLAIALFEQERMAKQKHIGKYNIFNFFCFRASCGNVIKSPNKNIPYRLVSIANNSSIEKTIGHYAYQLHSEPEFDRFRIALKHYNTRNINALLDALANTYYFSKPDIQQLKQIIKHYDLTRYDA